MSVQRKLLDSIWKVPLETGNNFPTRTLQKKLVSATARTHESRN